MRDRLGHNLSLIKRTRFHLDQTADPVVVRLSLVIDLPHCTNRKPIVLVAPFVGEQRNFGRANDAQIEIAIVIEITEVAAADI